MSKSLGNAIDPLEIIEKYGADALRFSILMITAQGADVYLAKDTFDIGRNFANKLWNATRFLLGACTRSRYTITSLPDSSRMDAADRWILSRLHTTLKNLDTSIGGFRLNEACHQLYDFVWRDFCDWYIEIKKADIYSDDPAVHTRAVTMLMYVLVHIVKTLQPFMPHLTEQLWQYLREKIEWPELLDNEYCIRASIPAASTEWIDDDLQQRFDLLKRVITALRTIRAENNVPPDKKGEAVIIPADDKTGEWLSSHVAMINSFARMERTIVDSEAQKPQVCAESVVHGTQVFVELEGLIDLNVERARIEKELEKTDALIGSSEKKLSNDKFLSRAPDEVVKKEKEKYEGLKSHREKLQASMARLQSATT
jgi:valyl-tRNA synthetase